MGEQAKSSPARPARWVYLLPAIHLCACSLALLGYVVPEFQFMGIVWTAVMVADLPISLVAFGLSWRHGLLAALWIVGIGTLWWYLLARGAKFVFHKFKGRPPGVQGLISKGDADGPSRRQA